MKPSERAGQFHGTIVAVKIVELTAPRGEAKAQLTEAKIATSLQHPNVVGASADHASTNSAIMHAVANAHERVHKPSQIK